MISDLIERLNKDFDKHLQRFIDIGENFDFSINSIKHEERNEINEYLEKRYGVKLIYYFGEGLKTTFRFDIAPGSDGYFNLLCRRASPNFKKYLDAFLTEGKSAGLDINRMDERMWIDLNLELSKQGILLNRERYKNGKEYMIFRWKKQVFQKGTQTLRERLFNHIKSAYPNIPDVNINAMLEETDSRGIYYLLRKKLNNAYGRPTRQEYKEVDKYFRKGIRDSVEYFEHGGALFGEYVGKDRVSSGHAAYHISLNVIINVELLMSLENIIRQDKRRIIQNYKFFDSYEEAVHRFDTVTIYTFSRDLELEHRIYNKIAKYVRSNEGLIGQEIGPGMVIVPETTEKYGKSVGQVVSDAISDMLQYAKTLKK